MNRPSKEVFFEGVFGTGKNLKLLEKVTLLKEDPSSL
jgi:hypothetical protein